MRALATLVTALRYALGVRWQRSLILATALSTSLLGIACGSRRPSAASATSEAATTLPPFSSAALMADLKRLCADDFAGRGSYQEGSAKAAQFLVDQFEDMGYEVIRQKVRGRHAENVIAVKRGDEQAVLISAHHDHLGLRHGKLYRGADDNASGVAVLLAIARSRAARDYKHTLLFVSFGAEEDGLVGSGVYIHDPFWPLNKTRAVVNFDMVGRNFFESGANQESTVAVVGLEGSAQARALATDAADTFALNMIEVPARLLELFDLHDRTDDWWFRRQEILSIHFSTGLHDDYHQVGDTVEKIVPGQLTRIAQMAASVIDGLAVDQENP